MSKRAAPKKAREWWVYRPDDWSWGGIVRLSDREHLTGLRGDWVRVREVLPKKRKRKP